MVENFQIKEILEQTNIYVAFKAVNNESGRLCYLKNCLVDQPRGLANIPTWEEEFHKVIKVITQASVKGLRTVVASGVNPKDGVPYIAYDWIEPNSVQAILAVQPVMAHEMAKELTRSMLEAVASMHHLGVVNGRITPVSVFHVNKGSGKSWVMNWDPIRSLRCKHGLNIFVSDKFSAPELMAGKDYTIQSDIYSVGKIIQLVFEGQDLPTNWAEWLKKMISRETSNRFSSMAEALREFNVINPLAVDEEQNASETNEFSQPEVKKTAPTVLTGRQITYTKKTVRPQVSFSNATSNAKRTSNVKVQANPGALDTTTTIYDSVRLMKEEGDAEEEQDKSDKKKDGDKKAEKSALGKLRSILSFPGS